MIKIEFSLEDLAAKFKKMQNDIQMVLAATMQTNRAMMFDKDGADNDKPQWAPLNTHFRSGRPLQNRGDLRKSLAPQNDGVKPGHGPDGIVQFEGQRVTIGTKLLKARMMNDGTVNMPGGVLRPVHVKALKIPLPGGNFMFLKSVKIPARPMDMITEADKREFSETLANYIGEKLSG